MKPFVPTTHAAYDDRRLASQKLAEDVEKFLARGGTIKVLGAAERSQPIVTPMKKTKVQLGKMAGVDPPLAKDEEE